MRIEFTSDPAKAKRNLARHSVSFKTAEEVFYDPYLLVLENIYKDDEQRYMAIGRTETQQLLSVIFVDLSTDEQEHYRVISAWGAEEYEQRAYAHQF